MNQETLCKYRATTTLRSRTYADEYVKHWVTSLSLALKRAVTGGDRTAIENITSVLGRGEPLEQCTHASYDGYWLLIAYCYYCTHSEHTTIEALIEALSRFPDDSRLNRFACLLGLSHNGTCAQQSRLCAKKGN